MSDTKQKKRQSNRPSAGSENVGRPERNRLFLILSLVSILLLTSLIGFGIARVAGTENLTAAYINGNFCGYVNSPALFKEAISAVEKSLSGTGSVAPVSACEITYQTVRAKTDSFLTEKDCEELLRKEIGDQYEDAYMLRINGVPVAAHEDFTLLEGLIRSVKEQLLANSGYDSVNLENVEIVRQVCAKSMLRSPDEITAILLPDQSEASVEAVTFYLASLKPTEPSFFPEIPEQPEITHTYQGTVEEERVIPRDTRYIDDPEHFIGVDEVIDEGADGLELVTFGVSYNSRGDEIEKIELSSELVTEAEERVVLRGTIPLPDTEPTGSFAWPCELLKGLSDGYGWRDLFGRADFHRGQDIPGYFRQPIYASDGGIVESAQWRNSFGNCVIISHGDTYSTLYAHLDQFIVSAGEEVYPGQLIGYMGQTGDAWGVHLHFEIQINGLYVNPYPYLPNPWY